MWEIQIRVTFARNVTHITISLMRCLIIMFLTVIYLTKSQAPPQTQAQSQSQSEQKTKEQYKIEEQSRYAAHKAEQARLTTRTEDAAASHKAELFAVKARLEAEQQEVHLSKLLEAQLRDQKQLDDAMSSAAQKAAEKAAQNAAQKASEFKLEQQRRQDATAKVEVEKAKAKNGAEHLQQRIKKLKNARIAESKLLLAAQAADNVPKKPTTSIPIQQQKLIRPISFGDGSLFGAPEGGYASNNFELLTALTLRIKSDKNIGDGNGNDNSTDSPPPPHYWDIHDPEFNRFRCELLDDIAAKPNANANANANTNPQEEIEKVLGIPLEKIFHHLDKLHNSCALLHTGWWSYEWCHEKTFRQFHITAKKDQRSSSKKAPVPETHKLAEIETMLDLGVYSRRAIGEEGGKIVVVDSYEEGGERAKRASFEEDENTRDEFRVMATDKYNGYIHY